MSDWKPIRTAPKEPRDGWYGPRILISTPHGIERYTVIARYHYGVHKQFLDENGDSCVGARPDCPRSYWHPLPDFERPEE